LGAAAAVALSALLALQNGPILRDRRWAPLFVLELPLWFSWLAMAAPIRALASRYPLTGLRWPRHLAVHLVAAVACAVALVAATVTLRYPLGALLGRVTVDAADRRYLAQTQEFGRSLSQGVRGQTVLFVVLYFGVVGLFHAVHYRRAYHQRLVRESELELMLARTQLDALKFQLQPHFLFNTLNTVSSLMSHDVRGARQVVAQLSDLLRYSLRDAERHEVTLAEEFDFLRAYVAIQEVRFRDALAVALTAAPRARRMLVPRMLLQPLVENAIRHGGREDGAPLHVRVGAAVADGRLTLTVLDDGVGAPGGGTPRERVGLRNTRARLAHLYPGEHAIALGNRAGGGFCAAITFPAREQRGDGAARGAGPSGAGPLGAGAGAAGAGDGHGAP
jgi:hypothetical protein